MVLGQTGGDTGEAQLIDELHLAVSPVLLGGGEPLFAGLDLPALGYTCVRHAGSGHAMHLSLARLASSKLRP